MRYICDAPGGESWFRLETEIEAEEESELMGHAVAKHFLRDRKAAAESFTPASSISFEGNIGLEPHIQKLMPLYLTLRDKDGAGLVTAKLPPEEAAEPTAFKSMVVGPKNGDPYADHSDAIKALGDHFGVSLTKEECFPYG